MTHATPAEKFNDHAIYESRPEGTNIGSVQVRTTFTGGDGERTVARWRYDAGLIPVNVCAANTTIANYAKIGDDDIVEDPSARAYMPLHTPAANLAHALVYGVDFNRVVAYETLAQQMALALKSPTALNPLALTVVRGVEDRNNWLDIDDMLRGIDDTVAVIAAAGGRTIDKRLNMVTPVVFEHIVSVSNARMLRVPVPYSCDPADAGKGAREVFSQMFDDVNDYAELPEPWSIEALTSEESSLRG